MALSLETRLERSLGRGRGRVEGVLPEQPVAVRGVEGAATLLHQETIL